MENNSNLVITIITILIVNSGLIIPSVAADGLILINNVTPFASPYGTISVNATSLDGIVSLPLYHGTLGENGSINLQLQQIGKERQNVTPASEAPATAQKALEQFGGLPHDAVLNGASTTYSEIYNYTLHATTYKEPMFTTISYSREIDGFWVYGDSNTIILTLGENGELLWLFKVWRNYTYTGDAKLIPIYTALEKLQRGEVLNEPMISGEKITIDIASPDYYAKEIGNNETVLEPIWLLVGTTESGSRIGFYIYARQFANFTATPTMASTGDTITFTDTSEASPIKWYWDFGDRTNSTLRDPTHAYKTGGNYTVNLTAWNDLGSDTISRTDYIAIIPDPKPVAGFTSNYSWDNLMPPLAVAFNDTSLGTITNWTWDFGDGTTSSEQNTTHVFVLLPHTVYRDFNVYLTVTDQYGRNSSSGEYLRIYKGYTPNFTANPTHGPASLNVTFTDLTEDMDTANSRHWDFGDGQEEWDDTPLSATVSHEYPADGLYNVTLTYWGVFEDQFVTTIDRYIIVGDDSPPVIPDFTANTTSGKSPLAVEFIDTSTGSPTRWNWSFGDGVKSTNQNPRHLYSLPGTYTVNLTSGNAYGENETIKTDYITVLPLTPPVAVFTSNTTSGKIPLAIQFTDTSSGSPTSWSWTFGDGEVSADQNPVHVYTTTGQFTVSLQVTNEDGSNTTTKEQFITGSTIVLPSAEFTANTTSGDAPLAVGFADQSSGSPVTWHWSFGDMATATDQNPIHVYAVPGTYTVSLEAMNPDGSNTTTKRDYITVFPVTGTVPATIRIEPETLNLNSRGIFTAFITFPEGYDVNDINPASVVCEGAHAKSGHATGEGSGMFIAKFDRHDLVGITPGNAVTFTVTGKVNANGKAVDFQGTDTVRVI